MQVITEKLKTDEKQKNMVSWVCNINSDPVHTEPDPCGLDI